MKGFLMPAGLMTTLSVLAYAVPAATCLLAGQVAGATQDGIPGGLFQFGALGLVAFMVWRKEITGERTAKLLDQRHTEAIRMTAQVVEALNRNSRAMESCSAHQKTVLLTLILCVALCCGCSGLQATSATAAAIDRDVVLMSAPLPADANAVAETLDYDAGRFTIYKAGATTNLLAYWFGGKTLYATARIYADLGEKADRSAEHLRRYRASTQPADAGAAATQPILSEGQPARWRSSHAAWMKTIKREKDGN